MAIKKNAAKADIGTKKQVKATFAECTAENPLKCKYHGLKAFDNLTNQCLAQVVIFFTSMTRIIIAKNRYVGVTKEKTKRM